MEIVLHTVLSWTLSFNEKSAGVVRKPSFQILWQTPNRHPNIKYVVRTFFEYWVVRKQDVLPKSRG